MKLSEGLTLSLVAFCLTLLVPADGAFAAGKTWYVDASVSQSGDGSSWPKAFKTIQEGIDAAFDGDTVTVAEGTYVENIGFKGKNIVVIGTNPLDPNVVANTIIDGNQAGPVVAFSGTERATCILSGFTIWNGKAPNGAGIFGGTWGNHTSASIAFNLITGNTATANGGGIFGCAGAIWFNIITINSAVSWGGGLAFCDGDIQGNFVTWNWADLGGGVAICHGTIKDNTITGNIAPIGGGIYSSSGTIEHNTIAENSASDKGGGLVFCAGTIDGNTIRKNLSDSGGGLFNCNGTIQNNLIVGNMATGDGGGIAYCDGVIRNNTTSGNSAGRGGGLACCYGTITNCIVWDGIFQSSTPSYTCGSSGGVGNTVSDPQFLDPDGADNKADTYEDNDYRLKPTSPCIDMGTNEQWMWGASDLDRNNRVFKGTLSVTVDMGAYEYGSFPFKVSKVEKPTASSVKLTWNSRTGDTYEIWSVDGFTNTPIWNHEATVSSQGQTSVWTGAAAPGKRVFYTIGLGP
jgi:hypothetical protein